MKYIHWMVAVVFFTASCDRILVLNVGGALRLSQILLVFIILAGIAWVIQHNIVLWPRGGGSILLWTALQGLLITQSLSITFSLQLYFLLLLLILGMFALLQLYGRSSLMQSLMQNYLRSYVFIAVCGLIQFVAPALHLGAPLVIQWILHGVIPRISGFNYEPSFYATYMVLGWVTLVDLRASGASIVSGRKWFWYTILVTLALFLSTSKTAWVCMMIEGLLRVSPIIWRFLGGQVRRTRLGSLVIPVPRGRLLIGVVAVLLGGILGLRLLNRIVDLNIFISGTGLNNTAAHSLDDRTGRSVETLKVIERHPWIGRSLGGVSADIAGFYHTPINTVNDLKLYWGFPVLLDTLAASGIPAFLPFLWFFFVITVGESKLVRTRWDDDRAKWLHALIRALALESVALLSDQYLLRIYSWIHVMMIVIVAYNLRYTAIPATNTLDASASATEAPATQKGLVPA